MFPLLVRSYHSLVGWNMQDSLTGLDKEFANLTSLEGPAVCVFGGFTNGIDVFSGGELPLRWIFFIMLNMCSYQANTDVFYLTEEVAYVFDDLLVSYPPPTGDDKPGISSLWLKAHNPNPYEFPTTISNRFEHTAALSEEGGMFIWGGQFQGTSEVKGVWMINVAGQDSQVSFTVAESDGIYDDYEATLTALHTIVLMMMFLSMTLTLLLGLTQRYNELIMQQTNRDAALGVLEDWANQDFTAEATPHARGRGLHPQIISTLPEKIYRINENAEDESQNNESNENEVTTDTECCPICLGKLLSVLVF